MYATFDVCITRFHVKYGYIDIFLLKIHGVILLKLFGSLNRNSFNDDEHSLGTISGLTRSTKRLLIDLLINYLI